MLLPRSPRAVAVAVAAVLLAGSSAGAVVLISSDDDGGTASLAQSTSTASSSPTPTPSPTLSPSPTPTPSPTATSASPTPSPSPTASPYATATASPSPTPEQLDADDRLTTTGVGPLQVGMTYEEVERASGHEVSVDDPYGTDSRCVAVTLVGIAEPEDVFMWGSDGRVRGFVLGEESTRATKSGVRIGDSEQRVREVYGDRLQEQAHPTNPAKKWLYVEASGHHVVLWLQDGRVFTMSSGVRQWTMMYEGCA